MAPSVTRRPPWTVRVASFSAAHRWPVIALWFVATIGIFLVSLAAGGTDAENAVQEDSAPEYESGRAYDVFNASGTTDDPSQDLLIVISSGTGTVDDEANAAAVADIVSRATALTSTVGGAVVPDLRPGHRPAAGPARGRSRLAGPHDGSRRGAHARRARGRGGATRARAGVPRRPPRRPPRTADPRPQRHPRERRHRDARQRRPRQLPAHHDPADLRDPAARLRGGGRGVRAADPGGHLVAGGVRGPCPVQPVRLAGQPVREPARGPDRPRRRGRLLPVHDHALPHGAATARQAGRHLDGLEHGGPCRVLLGTRGDDLDRRPVPARRSAVPLDGDRHDLGRVHLGRRVAHVPARAPVDPGREREPVPPAVPRPTARGGERAVEPRRAGDHAPPAPVLRRLGRVPAPPRVAGPAAAHRAGRFRLVPRLDRRRPGHQPHEREVAGGLDAPVPGRGHEGGRAGDAGGHRSTVGRARGAGRAERARRHAAVAGRHGRPRVRGDVGRPERPRQPGDRARRARRGRAEDLRWPPRSRGAGHRRCGLHRRRRRLLRGRHGPGVRVRPGLLVPAAARGLPFDRHPDQGDHPQPAIDRGGLRAARAGLPGGLGRRHPEREARRHRVVRPDLHLHDPVRPVDGLPRLHPHPDQGGAGPRAQLGRRGGAWHLDHRGHRHERRRDHGRGVRRVRDPASWRSSSSWGSGWPSPSSWTPRSSAACCCRHR